MIELLAQINRNDWFDKGSVSSPTDNPVFLVIIGSCTVT